jgi:hypothetical protein
MPAATKTRNDPFYTAPAKAPVEVDLPDRTCLMIDGQGDPNGSEAFAEATQALYSTLYTLKFTLKKAVPPRDVAVRPLEGLWWTEGREAFDMTDRTAWRWTLLLALPDTVTPEDVTAAIAAARRKKPLSAFDQLRTETLREGRCIQIMHVGPYATEPATIAKLHAYAREHGLRPDGKHHEIYLGDPRRTAPERLRTVLRQPVAPIA